MSDPDLTPEEIDRVYAMIPDNVMPPAQRERWAELAKMALAVEQDHVNQPEPAKRWSTERLQDLCRELGFDPKDVASIHINPHRVQVRAYREDEQGRRYRGDANEAATVTWDIAIYIQERAKAAS